MPHIIPRTVLIVFLTLVPFAAQATDSPGFDKYHGSLRAETKASGFFRVEQIDGRWWLVTPEGHPFFSTGINVLNMSGTATSKGVRHYKQAAKEIYGTPDAWAEAQTQRCKQWGWNTVGAWSDWRLFQKRMPYTVLLSIGGHNWLTGKMADIFSQEYRLAVRKQVKNGSSHKCVPGV